MKFGAEKPRFKGNLRTKLKFRAPIIFCVRNLQLWPLFPVADLQRQRIDQLRLEFCDEQRTLVNEFETERALICAQHNCEVHELQDIMYAMDQCFEDRDAEARAEFQSQRDELKNKVRTFVVFLVLLGSSELARRAQKQGQNFSGILSFITFFC